MDGIRLFVRIRICRMDRILRIRLVGGDAV